MNDSVGLGLVTESGSSQTVPTPVGPPCWLKSPRYFRTSASNVRPMGMSPLVVGSNVARNLKIAIGRA